MKIIFLGLLLSAFLLMTIQCAQTDAAISLPQNSDFSISDLSVEGQRAYQSLLTAQKFEEEYLYEDAVPSQLVLAFYKLSKEPLADKAFKHLLKEATLAGQLYALCGLYFTDRDFFTKAVEKYRNSDETVENMSGCMTFPVKIKDLVDRKGDKLYRDIIGGGYPEGFMRLGKRVEEKNKGKTAQ